jgi:hypothetical protein
MTWLIKAVLGFFALLGFGAGCALGWYYFCRERWQCAAHHEAEARRLNRKLDRDSKRRAKARKQRWAQGEFTPSPWEHREKETP